MAAWLVASLFCGSSAAVADPPQDAGDPRVPYNIVWDGHSPLYNPENFTYYRSLLQRIGMPGGTVAYAVYLPASTALGAFNSVYFQLGPQPQMYRVCEPRFFSGQLGIDVMLAGREVPLTAGEGINAWCSWITYVYFNGTTAGAQLQVALQANAGNQFLVVTEATDGVPRLSDLVLSQMFRLPVLLLPAAEHTPERHGLPNHQASRPVQQPTSPESVPTNPGNVAPYLIGSVLVALLGAVAYSAWQRQQTRRALDPLGILTDEELAELRRKL